MIKNITIQVDSDTDPDYIDLAKTAFNTVLATMLEGEKQHPGNEWKTVDINTHLAHEAIHCVKYVEGDTSEDHIAHALTRLAMIKALQNR
jgi:hypothetical protein